MSWAKAIHYAMSKLPGEYVIRINLSRGSIDVVLDSLDPMTEDELPFTESDYMPQNVINATCAATVHEQGD